MFSSKISKAVLTALLCVVLCCFLSTIIFAEDLTGTLSHVKIYRLVDNSYTWVDSQFTIDDEGNISTNYDYRAFQREMLDFQFSGKSVESMTIQFTLIVSASGSTPTVTQTAGSLRLRFDGTNVQTKTIRGGYRIQGNNVVYELSSTRFDFETPILIDEIDVTTYIQSVSSEVSYTNVRLIINDEVYDLINNAQGQYDDLTGEVSDFDSSVDSIVGEISGEVSEFDSVISEENSMLDDMFESITLTPDETLVENYISEYNTSFIAILESPMYAVFGVVPIMMLFSYVLFGRNEG